MLPTPKISPSQIATFTDCARKWYFGSVVKVPRVTHPSAEKGERIHTILEGYLGTGILVAPPTLDGAELAAIAESGICHLPDPAHFKIDLESAWSFTRETPGGPVLYNGRKDLEYDAADGIWTVGDHKTTSNLRYALTKEQLKTDPQGILYGAQALQARNRDKVRLTWIYYQTKRPYKSRLVEVVLDEAHVEAEMVKLDEIVGRKMLPLVGRKDLHQTEVEPNLQSCDKYGGCPYREICEVSPVARLRSVFTKFDAPSDNPLGIEKEEAPMSSILEKLKAAKALAAKQAAEGTNTGPNVNPPEATTPADPIVDDVKAPETVAIPEEPKAEAPTEPAPEEPKAKRTRGPNKPKEGAETTLEAKASPADPTAPKDEASRASVVLFVDASVSGSLGGCVIIADSAIYQAVHPVVNKELQVEDYALADFGKGAGAFAVAFAETLAKAIKEAESDGATSVVFLCDTRAREWAVTSSVWRSKADAIVKGN